MSPLPVCKQTASKKLPAALLGGFGIRFGRGGQLDHFVVVAGLIQYTCPPQQKARQASSLSKFGALFWRERGCSLRSGPQVWRPLSSIPTPCFGMPVMYEKPLSSGCEQGFGHAHGLSLFRGIL